MEKEKENGEFTGSKLVPFAAGGGGSGKWAVVWFRADRQRPTRFTSQPASACCLCNAGATTSRACEASKASKGLNRHRQSYLIIVHGTG